MKRLSEMVADVENKPNQKEEEKSKMKLLNTDLVKGIAKAKRTLILYEKAFECCIKM